MSRVAPCDALPIEKTDSSSVTTGVYAPSTGLKLTPWPDMLRYTRLMSLFNEQDLTFPEDVLDAFAGCLHHLSRIFPVGFVSGLPAMCFDAALLWQPWVQMKRRQSRRLPQDETVLPSWSWAGWEGVINSESWRSAANYQYEGPVTQNPRLGSFWKTFSTVQWQYSETLTSERHAINIPSQFARPSFVKVGKSMPPDWSTHVYPDEAGNEIACYSMFPLHTLPLPCPNQRDRYASSACDQNSVSTLHHQTRLFDPRQRVQKYSFELSCNTAHYIKWFLGWHTLIELSTLRLRRLSEPTASHRRRTL
jgi:hypothetical protein